MNPISVAFLLLSRNEEATIGEVIAAVKREGEALAAASFTVVLADDSSDKTREIASGLGCKIVAGEGAGLGAAYRKGLEYCAALGVDVIVSLDADGQADVSEVPRFLDPLREGVADLVIASRFLQHGAIGYRYPWLNRAGTWMLARFLSWMTGNKITDSHGGIRAMKAEVGRALEIKGNWTYVQESLIDASEKGFRILEVPSSWGRRKAGRSRVVRSIPLYMYRVGPVLSQRLFRSCLLRLQRGKA